ncbi:MAG: sporulation protein [Lachnospiraceae bacterium]|nr:sporulation protein [Lachnospiraceae bacterium]
MEKNNINETMKALFDGMNGFISTKTVVGDAVKVDGAELIPLIDVSFGMGAGAFIGDGKDKGAGGMNGKLSPSSVIVVKDGYTKVISLKNADAVTKIVDMMPDIINRFSKKDSKEVKDAVEEIKNKDLNETK